MQNYCIFNLLGLYLNSNIDLIMIGLFNIVISITIMIADSDTYYQFSMWFDFLGIQPVYK